MGQNNIPIRLKCYLQTIFLRQRDYTANIRSINSPSISITAFIIFYRVFQLEGFHDTSHILTAQRQHPNLVVKQGSTSYTFNVIICSILQYLLLTSFSQTCMCHIYMQFIFYPPVSNQNHKAGKDSSCYAVFFHLESHSYQYTEQKLGISCSSIFEKLWLLKKIKDNTVPQNRSL